MSSDQQGYTILEMLVASSIFAIALGAIYMMYATGQSVFAWGTSKIEGQQNARLALQMMAQEIRMAGYDPTAPPVIPQQDRPTAIQTGEPDEIRFIADVTGDTISDLVSYRLEGDTVIREISSWVGGGWTPNPPGRSELADGVSALSFTYYDRGNNVTDNRGDIRRVTIAVTVRNTAAGRTETFPLTMDVRLRNPGP